MTVAKIVASEIERLVFTVSGPDAGKYLHSQLSNDVASLLVGQSRYSFVLEPMGKVIALVRVTRTEEETFILDTENVAGLDEQLLARLNRFKIRVFYRSPQRRGRLSLGALGFLISNRS